MHYFNLFKQPSASEPARLVYLWSEVSSSASEPTLKGEPNAVEKKFTNKEGQEVSTENPETPQGRNIIRGQAIMMLRRFPYEADSKDLHDAIAASRRAEMGIKEAGSESPFPPTVKGQELKTKLDAFRTAHTTTNTETGNVTLNVPSHLSLDLPYLTEIPDGRNFLRAEAMKRLKQVPQTDDNKEARDTLRAALAKSTKMETGQWYNEIDPDTKAVRGVPADKAKRSQDKKESADELATALVDLPAPVTE